MNIVDFLKRFFSKFKTPEAKLLSEPGFVISLTDEQAIEARGIFECALCSENSATGEQECLGCGTSTVGPKPEHKEGCIVDYFLVVLPCSQDPDDQGVCPRCGTGLFSETSEQR
jgi:hypothetical protein